MIDAVKLVTHVFRNPDADGYLDIRKFAAGKLVTPLIAPNLFTLRLADIGVD